MSVNQEKINNTKDGTNPNLVIANLMNVYLTYLAVESFPLNFKSSMKMSKNEKMRLERWLSCKCATSEAASPIIRVILLSSKPRLAATLTRHGIGAYIPSDMYSHDLPRIILHLPVVADGTPLVLVYPGAAVLVVPRTAHDLDLGGQDLRAAFCYGAVEGAEERAEFG